MLHGVMEIMANMTGNNGWLHFFQPLLQVGDISNLLFFQQINDFLRDEIETFGIRLFADMMKLVGAAALTLMTLWILIQGFRIVTGQTRDSMMALVSNSLRATLIVSIATGAAVTAPTLYKFLSTDLTDTISEAVTGNPGGAAESIDKSLTLMQLALGSIDSIDVSESDILNESKSRALWFTGIGTAGPAITGGAMLLLNSIAMALFVGLAPLFILCLLFDQTKQLFSKWLYYGIGTMFSLAVLSVMVSIALKMVIAVATSFWVSGIIFGAPHGVSSMALQQGGLGLLLTVLIISAPPIAAAFFQGVLANFTPYTAFSNDGGLAASRAASQAQSAGYPPGHPAYTGSPPPTDPTRVSNPSQNAGRLSNPSTPYNSNYASRAEAIRPATEAQQAAAGSQQTPNLAAGPSARSPSSVNAPQPSGSRGLNRPEGGSDNS